MGRTYTLAALVATLGLAVAGCGSSSSSTTSTPTATTATTGSTAAHAGTAGASTVSLSADPSGQLAYNTTSLTAKSGNVSINFTNMAPLMHNVTVANASGQVLGATPTFSGGSKTLTLALKPGTYTFYCSVPGHRQAGMQGTLTVQ